jgi:glucose-6-phosphate dehydrogenase assembly protein OpcA
VEDVVTPEPPRAVAATLIAVVPQGGCEAAAAVAAPLARSAGVQPIVVSLGNGAAAAPRRRDGAIVIDALPVRYLNNAVAALRLSSLPAVGWWRVPSADALPDLAPLVDRLVLDLPEPLDAWTQVAGLARLTAISDLRWTRLTRWRQLIARFFDLPEFRAAIATFDRLEVEGADPAMGRLLGGWLRTRLPAGDRLARSHAHAEAPLEAVRLGGPEATLSLRLLSNRTCIETRADGIGRAVSRVVPLGDQGTTALLGEELRIRARDVAFEAAATAAAQERDQE